MPKKTTHIPLARLLELASKANPLIEGLMERRRETLATLADIDTKLASLGALPDGVEPPAPPTLSPMDSILLSIEQVCVYLGGISQSKIFELVSSRQMPAPKKLGRLARWKRSDLDDWVSNL